MLELSPQQVAVLEQLATRGFKIVSFPLYGNAVGVRQGNCAALLQPIPGASMKLVGEPSYVVDGNPSVRVDRGGKQFFVWKKKQVEVTPERQAELDRFSTELAQVLLSA